MEVNRTDNRNSREGTDEFNLMSIWTPDGEKMFSVKLPRGRAKVQLCFELQNEGDDTNLSVTKLNIEKERQRATGTFQIEKLKRSCECREVRQIDSGRKEKGALDDYGIR